MMHFEKSKIRVPPSSEGVLLVNDSREKLCKYYLQAANVCAS
jgi:hypothetical protein